MGMVSLVGAGPGDPELITVKGWKRIGSCDALLYDYLAPQALVSAVRKDCALICVGKRAGGMSASQEEINRLLVSCAGKYERVVRLKGGDPFVFGRGGEEALALQEAGVPYEVIPGVTSAIAAPEAAGLPVTHRGVSRSFHVVTGQTRAGEEDSFLQDSLRTLAGTEGTLLFLMSVGKIGEICTGLMENGRSPDTPAAVIENGTLPGQRRIDGTLGTIAGIAERERVVSPAVLVIGETAAFHLAGERNGQESVPADGEAMSAVAVAEVCSENGAVCAVPDETGLPAEGSMGLSAPDGAACTVSDDAELLAAGSAGQISRIGAVGTRETLARFAAALGAGTEQPAGFVPLLTMEVRETEEYGTLREETARLASYDWIVFLSRQAVNLFFRALSKSGRDARALAPCRVAVNGAGTAAVLAEHGIRA
ncbi:MAG: uroporphyrinogen-III C-methyltransferase, partial [Eubacteriales bacterium]|nr:uroporphyrinogen-III C-methyltransferase [Eubacteriales bacterium]